MHLPILDHFIRHDTGIMQLLKEKKLVIENFPKDEQFQPATLDVRIGSAHVYDRDTTAALNEYHMRMEQFFSEVKKGVPTTEQFDSIEPVVLPTQYDGNSPVLIPSGAYAEIILEERLELDKNYFFTPELRSSRGRVHFELLGMEVLPDNKYKLKVRNFNINDIVVPPKSKFAQLFVGTCDETVEHDGFAVNNPKEIEHFLPNFPIENILASGYLRFDLGKDALKFKKLKEPFELGKDYSESTLYEKINLETGYVIKPGEALVAQLEPTLKLPSDIGILLIPGIPKAHPRYHTGIHYDMSLVDKNQVKAGWVDPGFPGLTKEPATITAHPYRAGRTELLKTGMPFAYGILYKFKTPVDRPYGDKKLNSHYSDVKGLSGSKS